jgi:hypothetical protein
MQGNNFIGEFSLKQMRAYLYRIDCPDFQILSLEPPSAYAVCDPHFMVRLVTFKTETTDVGVTNVILIFGHSGGDITAQSARLRHATVASCSNLKSQMGTVGAKLPITECIQPGLLQTRPEDQNEKANELRRRRTILETMQANFLPPKT